MVGPTASEIFLIQAALSLILSIRYSLILSSTLIIDISLASKICELNDRKCYSATCRTLYRKIRKLYTNVVMVIIHHMLHCHIRNCTLLNFTRIHNMFISTFSRFFSWNFHTLLCMKYIMSLGQQLYNITGKPLKINKRMTLIKKGMLQKI